MIKLKLDGYDEVIDDISNLRGNAYRVKITTTKKDITYDRKDYRNIQSLNNIKLIFKAQGKGVYILRGNLQCDFKPPFGGMFYLKNVCYEENVNFEDIKGISEEIMFVDLEQPTTIEEMQIKLLGISQNQNFEFNISQFDEFMELFEFYQKLSNELNNNISYKINSLSKPYYFIDFDVKEFESEFKTEIKDQNGVLKGYRIEEFDYHSLKNDIKEKVHEIVDIRFDGSAEEISSIRRIGADNIYVSNLNVIREKDIKNLKQLSLINLVIDKGEIVLSAELKNVKDYEENYQYLNLYDMGQKIKVESIDNSLRLINQGATGAAVELLQYLIGDNPMPSKRIRRLTVKEKKYIEGLNESQKKAFLMATDGCPVSLIKGPPGTGKTHVINAIVQYITKELNEKVIISSQTHIAIDNVLDKLMSNHDLIVPNRITNRKNKYSNEYIDETLYRTWGSKFFTHNERSTNEELKIAMSEGMKKFKGDNRFNYSAEMDISEFPVIGATTTTSAISGKKGLELLRGYDWLIIDEVSKCPITEVLRYLPYVKRIIMVGDDFQLAPLLEFSKDDVKDLESFDEDMFSKLQNMYEKSVFSKVLEKAKSSGRLVLLNENYRSVKQVLATYNVFYDGELEGKREDVNPNKVHFITNDADIDYEKNDVIFVEVVGGQEAKDGTSRFNVEEIKATQYILKDLIKKTIDPSKVSVSAIFPYAAQINHFQKNNIKLINEAKKIFKSFEIDTVDAFQGKEADIVLVNTVVTDPTQSNFLNNFRRINVSMSRAKDKLIIFGNPYTLKKIDMKINDGYERKFFGDIINYISTKGTYIKYNGGVIEDGNKSKSGIKLA